MAVLAERLVRALEAFEAGDVEYGCAILRLVVDELAPRRFGCACSDCGQTFQWPGLLDRHRLLWHELEEAA